jgi:UDP-2,3-diacylglucosamine hydrolase
MSLADGSTTSALFISDVHVSSKRPLAVAALLDLLDAARPLGCVYLLGDVFDQWLGDDDQSDPFPDVERAVAMLTSGGTAVYAQHGNHDFLLGAEFAARTGCVLLNDVVSITLGTESAVIMHGDTLCTEDHEYQAYRAYTRDEGNQAQFLGLTFEERTAIADQLRHKSSELRPLKAADIMDVSDEAVRVAISSHGARWLIHGHTHRPGVHELHIDGKASTRIVLGDWYDTGHVALFDSSTVTLLDVPSAMAHLAQIRDT